jgi:hypothetical protein
MLLSIPDEIEQELIAKNRTSNKGLLRMMHTHPDKQKPKETKMSKISTGKKLMQWLSPILMKQKI